MTSDPPEPDDEAPSEPAARAAPTRGPWRSAPAILLGVGLALVGLLVVGKLQRAGEEKARARDELLRELPALARTTVGPFDDLAKKRAELRERLVRVERLSDLAGPEADVLRCSARGLERQLSLAVSFQEATRATDAARLDPAQWTSREGVDAARQHTERRLAALSALREATLGGTVAYAVACMKDRHVAPKLIADAEASARASRPKELEALFSVQEALLGQTSALLALLGRAWGTWRLTGGHQLEFDDPVIGRDYVERTRKIADLDVRETELLRAASTHTEAVRVDWPKEATKPEPSASASR